MDAPKKLTLILECIGFLILATLISSATVIWGGIKVEPDLHDPSLNAHARIVNGY
jgi:hypothetical protein